MSGDDVEAETGLMNIRRAVVADGAALRDIAESAGLFVGDELDGFQASLTEYFRDEPSDAHWVVIEEGLAGVTGAAYYVAEPFTSGVWNILFIGVQPARQGKGRGRALMTSVEQHVRTLAARIILVETSGLEGFERTRAFYRLQGFDEEARIRDYYGPGDDKITFSKNVG